MILGCLFGVIVGSYQVGFIIDLAVPALMFLYPITIILIILNVLPEKYTSKLIFRGVVLTTFLFSIPDFLGFIINPDQLTGVKNVIPLANYNLGWVLPAILVFVLFNIFDGSKKVN